jgi:hypothetical protein
MFSSALLWASKTRRGTALGRAKTAWSGFNRTKLTIGQQFSAEEASLKGPIFIKAPFFVATSGKRRRQKMTATGEFFSRNGSCVQETLDLFYVSWLSKRALFYLGFTRNIRQNLENLAP